MAHVTRPYKLIIVLLLLSLICVVVNIYTCIFNEEHCYITHDAKLDYQQQVYIEENKTINDMLPVGDVSHKEDSLLYVTSEVTWEDSAPRTTEEETILLDRVNITVPGIDNDKSHGPVISVDNEMMSVPLNLTETCKHVCPPFKWSLWSPCSKACGRGHSYRKAVYEFVCPLGDNETCLDHKIEVKVCQIPCQFDPNKYGGKDGLPLYPTNPLNPPIYPEERDYMCGQWIHEYTTLHKAILRGDRPPSFMVYSTGKGTYPTPGGLADRIKGITTVFFLAVLLDRAFIIEWDNPPGLTRYLVPKYFNWTIPHKLTTSLRTLPVHDIGSWRVAKDNGISSQWHMNTNFSLYFSNPIEVLQGNRYDYTYALLRNPTLMPKAYKLGIDRINCRICCAFDLLFSTNVKFLKSINDILSLTGSPRKPYIALYLHIKSNDVDDVLAISKTYINCIHTVSKEMQMSHPLIIPVFYNQTIFHAIAKRYPSEMKELVNSSLVFQPSHIHLSDISRDTDIEDHGSIQKRTFQDFYFILKSSVLIRSKGYLVAFGNIADAIRQHYNPIGRVVTYLTTDTVCLRQPKNSRIE